MPNELIEKEPRYGSIVDGDPGTPDIQGALEFRDGRIVLSIPWPTDESPYAAWFGLGGNSLGGGKYRVPKTLLFNDNGGSVVLSGCRGVGFSATFFGPGTGRIEADLAVLGPHNLVDFTHVNGIVTTLTGMRAWLGTTTVEAKQEVGHGTMKTTLEVADGASIRIRAKPEVVFEPRHRLERPSAENETKWIVHDYVRNRTVSSELTRLDALLDSHNALRDLLSLSRWRTEVLNLEFVSRNDDFRTSDGGKSYAPEWRRVVQRRQTKQDAAGASRDHLYEFSDMGEDGLLAWFDLRQAYERAIDPVLAAVEMGQVTASARLAQTGPGVEALGYLLAIRDGDSPAVAARQQLKPRLDRIIADVAAVVPFSTTGWSRAFANTYNGIKHANRTLPNDIEVLRAWRDATNMVRAWVGLELGIDAAKLHQRFQQDWLGKIDWESRD